MDRSLRPVGALIGAIAILALVALVAHEDAPVVLETAAAPGDAQAAQLKTNYEAAQQQAAKAAETSDKALIKAAEGHEAADELSKKAASAGSSIAAATAQTLKQAAAIQQQEAAGAAKTAEDKQHHKLDLKEKLHTVQVVQASGAAQEAALAKAVADAQARADAETRAAVASAEAKSATQAAQKETAAAQAASANDPLYLELRKKYDTLHSKMDQMQQDRDAEKEILQRQIQDQQNELKRLRGELRDGADTINEAKAVEQGAIPPAPPPDERETTELKKEVAGYKAKLRIAENALVTIDKAAEQKLKN